MQISSNMSGNYNPYSFSRINQVQQGVEARGTSETVKASANRQQPQVQEPAVISSDEKAFFEKLYPENINEIRNYHFYQKSGKMQGVTVGSLFDRRG